MITAKEFPALKERFRTLIRDELNLPRLKETDDGDFTFRYELMSMKLVFDKGDSPFVWLARFGFHWLRKPDAAELARVDRCINLANYRTKAAKVVRMVEPDSDGDYGITASISWFVEDVESQKAATLERYLHQIKVACRAFWDALETEDADEADLPVTASSDTGLRH